jgi:hypothetical protein
MYRVKYTYTVHKVIVLEILYMYVHMETVPNVSQDNC